MNNVQRETYIRAKLQSGDWKTTRKKTGFKIQNKSGTVIAAAPSRHTAEKLAVTNTIGDAACTTSP